MDELTATFAKARFGDELAKEAIGLTIPAAGALLGAGYGAARGADADESRLAAILKGALTGGAAGAGVGVGRFAAAPVANMLQGKVSPKMYEALEKLLGVVGGAGGALATGYGAHKGLEALDKPASVAGVPLTKRALSPEITAQLQALATTKGLDPEQRRLRDLIEKSVQAEQRKLEEAKKLIEYGRKRVTDPKRMGGTGTFLFDTLRAMLPGMSISASANGGIAKRAQTEEELARAIEAAIQAGRRNRPEELLKRFQERELPWRGAPLPPGSERFVGTAIPGGEEAFRSAVESGIGSGAARAEQARLSGSTPTIMKQLMGDKGKLRGLLRRAALLRGLRAVAPVAGAVTLPVGLYGAARGGEADTHELGTLAHLSTLAAGAGLGAGIQRGSFGGLRAADVAASGMPLDVSKSLKQIAAEAAGGAAPAKLKQFLSGLTPSELALMSQRKTTLGRTFEPLTNLVTHGTTRSPKARLLRRLAAATGGDTRTRTQVLEGLQKLVGKTAPATGWRSGAMIGAGLTLPFVLWNLLKARRLRERGGPEAQSAAEKAEQLLREARELRRQREPLLTRPA